MAGHDQLSDFAIEDLGLGTYAIATTQTQPCFAAGTLIETVRGERPVELIREGDELVLPDGSAAPVIWTGRRRVSCAGHPDPASVRPVRIRAGAFADGVPRRDLVVSPDHALFVDGRLIPAGLLCNGSTIIQEDADQVRYHHLELDRRSIIIAEGMMAESYFDTGNRRSFANALIASDGPDSAPRAATQTSLCAPMILEGPELDALRAGLSRRLPTLDMRPAA